PHQNATGGGNAPGPAQIEEHARHIEEVNAEVTGLAVAEFAGVAPTAGMDARFVITPRRRPDIHLPIQGGGGRGGRGKAFSAAVIAVDIDRGDFPEVGTSAVGVSRFPDLWWSV